MNETLQICLSVGIPAMVSIIGFIVTVKTMKSNFQNELKKQKADVQLEKMAPIPYELLELLQSIINGTKNKNSKRANSDSYQEKLNYLYSSIFAYGSINAIRIIAYMQKKNYENIDNDQRDYYKGIAIYVLAVVQIRYDITGEVVSPEYWYQLKITDYSANREKIKKANNELVKELKLDLRFMID